MARESDAVQVSGSGVLTHRSRESDAQRSSGHPIRADVVDFAPPHLSHNRDGASSALRQVRQSRQDRHPRRCHHGSAIRIRRHAAFSAPMAGAAKETVAEGVGFEPTRHFCPPVFKTGSIGRSDSPPEYKPSLADTPAAETPPSGNRLGSCCDFDSSASHNNYQVD